MKKQMKKKMKTNEMLTEKENLLSLNSFRTMITIYPYWLFTMLYMIYDQVFFINELTRDNLITLGIIGPITDSTNFDFAYGIKKICNYGYNMICKKGEEYHLIKYNKYMHNHIIKDKNGTFVEQDFKKFKEFIDKSNNNSSDYYYNELLRSFSEKNKKEISGKRKNKFNKKLSVEPRHYQDDAYIKIKEALNSKEKNNRGILWMACGMGKTLVSIMNATDYDCVLFLSPLISSAYQNLERFKSELKDYESILICSDESIGTREIKKIKPILENDKFIISCTYDSIDVLTKLIPDINDKNKKVFVVTDEFHNLSKGAVLGGKYVESNADKNFQKFYRQKEWHYLFMSATPRLYETKNNKYEDDMDYDEVVNKISDDETEIDEDGFDVLGEIIYVFMLRDAIEEGFITDYSMYIPDIHIKIKTFMDHIYEKVGIKAIGKKLLNDAKAFFLLRGMTSNGHKKNISYLSKKVVCGEFANSLIRMNKYFGLDLKVFIVTANVKQNDRKEIYKEFARHDGHAIICSVRILQEAIDIIECDSVFFGRKVDEKINIIQMISRSNRIFPLRPNKESGIYVWADEHSDLTKIVGSLKEYDFGFVKEKVKIINYEKINEQSKSFIIKRKENIGNNKNLIDENYNLLDKFIIKVKKLISWREKLFLLKWYHNKHGKYPSRTDKNDSMRSLAYWYYDQKILKEYYLKNNMYRYNELNKLKNWNWSVKLTEKRKGLYENILMYINWINIYERLPKRYMKINEHDKTEEQKLEEKIYEHASRIRQKFTDKRDEFEDEWIDMLEELGVLWFWSSTSDEYGITDDWYKKYELLRDWILEHIIIYNGDSYVLMPTPNKDSTEEAKIEKKVFEFNRVEKKNKKNRDDEIIKDGYDIDDDFSEKDKKKYDKIYHSKKIELMEDIDKSIWIFDTKDYEFIINFIELKKWLNDNDNNYPAKEKKLKKKQNCKNEEEKKKINKDYNEYVKNIQTENFLGRFCYRQRVNFEKKILDDFKIYLMESLVNWDWTIKRQFGKQEKNNMKKWLEKWNTVKEWIFKKERKPLTTSKNKTEKSHAVWLSKNSNNSNEEKQEKIDELFELIKEFK